MNTPVSHSKTNRHAGQALGLGLGVLISVSLLNTPLVLAADTTTIVNTYQAAALPITGTRSVTLTLQGSNINEYLIAETPNFLNTSWTLFAPNGTSFLAADGQMVEVMTLPFILSEGDGDKTIYIKYRNAALVQSAVMTVSISLRQGIACTVADTDPSPLLGCEGLPLTPIGEADRAKYRLGVSPTQGEYVPASFIFSGDYIRSANSTTVYCVTTNLTLRPFMDETSFFTQALTFLPVKWVRDRTLDEFTKEPPMLLRENVGLVKFESDPEVYHFIQDPLNPNRGILHWIATEELATYIAGDTWANYVIDINPTLADSFVVSTPYLTLDDVLAADIDLSNFRARQLLNERSSVVNDPGVVSNLFQQGLGMLRSAGDFISQGLKSISDVLRGN